MFYHKYLGEVRGVVDEGALLQHEAGVEEELPDVEEDGLQLPGVPVDKVAEPQLNN